MDSYADHLRPFLPYIPSDLISVQSLQQILSVTQHLPPALGLSPFMFECSLDDGTTADFSVAALAARGGHTVLSRLGAGIARPPLDDAGWRRIRQFALSWASASSGLSQAVEETWLEFDVGLTRDIRGDTPSVFFSLDYESPRESTLRRRLAGEYIRVAKEGLEILEGGQTVPETLTILTQSFATLPALARIRFLGAMTSRNAGTIRVLASEMAVADVIRYLRRLGFRGSVGNLALITEIAELADDMWLAADLGAAGVSSRIGFELYCDSTAQLADSCAWAGLLDYLVEKGVCLDRKRTALLAAADMSDGELDRLAWPDSLRKISKVLGPAGFDRIELHLHHVKVIDRPGFPPEAKAYLYGRYK